MTDETREVVVPCRVCGHETSVSIATDTYAMCPDCGPLKFGQRCTHGSLARKCEQCDLTEIEARMYALQEALLERDKRLAESEQAVAALCEERDWYSDRLDAAEAIVHELSHVACVQTETHCQTHGERRPCIGDIARAYLAKHAKREGV